MKIKTSRYIKKAKKMFLERKAKEMSTSVEYLINYLSWEVIPCASMSEADNAELEKGLKDMIQSLNQQTELLFKY